MRCSRPAAAWASRAAGVAGPVIVAIVSTVALAGCGSGPAHPAAAGTASPTVSASQLAPPHQTCGTSHTAVDVPVLIEVEQGDASCPLAMHIQTAYTGLVRSGRVPGNGGGAPVKVDGWTCQGTDTTTTVQTGEASECRKGTTEIVAVLKLQGSGSSG
jgi:hypothetical protein